MVSRMCPSSNARWARSSAVRRSRISGVGAGATPATLSAIENTLARLDGLQGGKGDHDDYSEDDRCDHVSASDLDGPAKAGCHELELGIAERAHLGQVEPLELHVGAHALADEDVDDDVEHVREREGHADQRAHADELRQELPRVAVEEARDGAVDAVPAAAVVARPVGEEAHAEDAPEAASPGYRGRAHGVVDLHHALEELDAQADEHAGREADDRRADRVDEAARGRDRREPGEEPVPAHRRVGLSEAHPHVEEGAEGAGAAREHGVHGDRADAEVAGARRPERASGVEAEPAEGEDEAAEQHHRDVMARDRVRRAVAVELADARADDHRDRERGEAADGVHDPRAGEVAVAVAELEVAAELREPPAAPGPVAEERAGDRAEDERGDRERGELPALGGGAGDDRRRGVHEHHLAEEHHHDADVVGAGELSTADRERPGCGDAMTKSAAERVRGPHGPRLASSWALGVVPPFKSAAVSGTTGPASAAGPPVATGRSASSATAAHPRL